MCFKEHPVFSWCPQDPKGVDHLAVAQELRRRMGREPGDWWLEQIDKLAERNSGISELVRKICWYDAPEMVELLYPVMPEIFRASIGLYDQMGSAGALVQCALRGSAACLETLLELGADPNGLDCGDWNTVKLHQDPFAALFPVTPLDCARAEGHEDCCLLLELYGGVTMGELCGIPEEEMPVEFPELCGPWRLEEAGEALPERS